MKVLLRTVLKLWVSVAGLGVAMAAPSPRLVCEQPVYDFGVVEPPREVRHAFVVRNAGDAPLRIAGVRTTCGCVVGKVENLQVPPGGEVKLDTALPTEGRDGRQRATILLISDDPRQPHFPLVLSGVVAREWISSPSLLVFGHAAPGAAAMERVVQVRYSGTSAAALKPPIVSTTQLSAQLVPVEPGRRWEVRVTFRPSATPGIFQGDVRLPIEGRAGSEVVVPVSALVGGALLAAPAEMVMDPGDKAGISRHVIVRAADEAPFEIVRVELPDKRMTSQVQRFGPARYRVRLDGLSAELGTGKVVRLHTDRRDTPVLEIPIRVLGAGKGKTP